MSEVPLYKPCPLQPRVCSAQGAHNLMYAIECTSTRIPVPLEAVSCGHSVCPPLALGWDRIMTIGIATQYPGLFPKGPDLQESAKLT